MHAYDVSRRQSYSPVPYGRATQDGASATPIYDALYDEYVKSFRACPGDRSGEEELAFTAFSNSPYTRVAYDTGRYGTGHGTPQHATGHLAAQHGHTSTAAAAWEQVARHARGMHHLPALPPAPRRGL
ncbi:hypothetical protein [Streptomyces colonosanans]|uniref:Uncharacterized protein n=1 Tax=Streptomyces colonosanans TaxID=1428652 RepID=A0A1S2PWF6_9ACTN|nr:hypothetical protein [Streptomyces colonosanans]OIJ97735.1 hypothetical protein BIV24_06855 [Streptomyces colonosanans]